MEAVQIEILGVVVRHPWSVATNVALAVECFWLGALTLRGRAPQPRLRGAFFLALGVGAAFGAPKHGFPLMPGHEWVRFASNVGLGVAVTFAQLAAIRARVPSRGTARVLERLALVQLTVFLAVTAFTRDFAVVAVHMSVGMIPLLAAATRAAARGCRASGWIAVGLAVAMAGGVAYALRVGVSPWFNHVDVAHVLLAVTVAFVFVGAHAPWLPAGSGRGS